MFGGWEGWGWVGVGGKGGLGDVWDSYLEEYGSHGHGVGG